MELPQKKNVLKIWFKCLFFWKRRNMKIIHRCRNKLLTQLDLQTLIYKKKWSTTSLKDVILLHYLHTTFFYMSYLYICTNLLSRISYIVMAMLMNSSKIVSSLCRIFRPLNHCRVFSAASQRLQSTYPDISGIYPPIPTPFTKNGDICYEMLKENFIKWNQHGFTGQNLNILTAPMFC